MEIKFKLKCHVDGCSKQIDRTNLLVSTGCKHCICIGCVKEKFIIEPHNPHPHFKCSVCGHGVDMNGPLTLQNDFIT